MARILAIVSVIGVFVSCNGAIVSPAAPTSITTAAPVAAFLELQAPAAPDYRTGTGVISIAARALDGTSVDVDVVCSSSAGLLVPAQFNTRRGVLELQEAHTRARVTCASGAAAAAVDVDLSAWSVDIYSNDFTAAGELAGLSRVVLSGVQRIAQVPVTRLSIAWGDGAVDVAPLMPVPLYTMRHFYRTAGHYRVTARIEWAGGAAERQLEIFGGPAGSQP